MATTAAQVDLRSFYAGRVPGPIVEILGRFAEASTRLRDELAMAPLSGMLGATGDTNVQQEATAKLDERGNEIMREALSAPEVGLLISEEEADLVVLGDGPYTCCYDPLDGSSNIGFAAVGSILGIYTGVTPETFEGGQLTGRQLEASAFTVYGLPSVLVVAAAGEVNGFVFDTSDQQWRLAFPQIQLPKASYTSINWTYLDRWPAGVVAGVAAASEGLRGRYSGSMVEDMLRILMSGGVFMYPEDSSSPAGKLRMLYEICPMSLVVECAGGGASIGAQAALDVPVTKPHQRSPFVAGSAAAVTRYDDAYRSARG
jgi:fructose-1,6-bisphosphatase I